MNKVKVLTVFLLILFSSFVTKKSNNNRIEKAVVILFDEDGDGVDSSVDLDDDNDGIPDVSEGIYDFDNDGKINSIDLDSDNDGITDVFEVGGIDANHDGMIDGTDTDADGLSDLVDTDTGGIPLLVPDFDGDGNQDFLDIDTDNDGIVDNIESQTTIGYFSPSGLDVNNNGLDDAYEGVGYIITTNTDGADSPDYLDLDSDNDTYPDTYEAWWNAAGDLPDEIASGIDIDNDGLDDAYDADDMVINPTNGQTPLSFPDYDNPGGDRDWRDETDNDDDGISDIIDIDDDNDGILDTLELLASSLNYDVDNDGVANSFDLDSDNDGIVDNIEAQSTFAYIAPSNVDLNGNGLDDIYEGSGIINPVNSDGVDFPDFMDVDSDNDAIFDIIEAWDTNNDGVSDTLSSFIDSDNDGFDNAYDSNDTLFNPTNGQTPFSFPNFDNAATPERDWREYYSLHNENFTFNNFKSFPNPVKNLLTISNASPIETIEISSILGQKMISKKVNDIQTEIDLSQLSNGIYFVKVISQGNEKTIKIVKE